MSATKYKAGDKVLLRDDLRADMIYGDVRLADSTLYLIKNKNRILTIKNVNCHTYNIEENSLHRINDEMIVGKVEEDMGFTKADLRTGMIVTFENGTEGVVFFNNCFTANNEDIIIYVRENMEFGGYDKLSVWTDDLKHNGFREDPLYNIKKVELPSKYDKFILGDLTSNCRRYIVWERDSKLRQAKQLLAEHYGKQIEDIIIALK